MSLLVIDPGHGGYDPGAVGNGLEEKDVTLNLSRLIRAKLSRYDVRVALTRDADVFRPLSARAAFANAHNADYFLSIHVNAGGGTGFETFTYTTVGAHTSTMRSQVHAPVASYLASLGFADRGKKRANFAVVRETAMPAMLAENLFIDRARDAAALKRAEVLNRLAVAYAAGIARAMGLHQRA